MSPEQARGETSSLTPATDVWSLGCVLYAMLAGRPPFEGETDAAVVGQVLLRDPPRLRAVRGDVPGGVDRVVRSAMAKRARERYPDAGTMREDLDRVLRGERPRARLPGAWRWKAWAAGVALAAAATIAAVARPKAEGIPAPPPAPAAPSEAEALAAQARALRGVDPRRAEALLRRALDLGPFRDDWRLEHGLLLWALGKGAEARQLWGEIRPGSPEAAAGRLYRGLEAFFRLEEGRLRADEAEPDLRILAAVPGREGRISGAVLAVIENLWAQAREALRAEPGWEAALLRGYVEDSDPKGDGGDAVREYSRALDEGIRFAWALNNRGIARQAQGDLPGAIRDYGEALEINPRLAEAWNNLGLARQGQGDLPGAIGDYRRALVIAPRYAKAWCNRGNARQAQGDLPGAIEDYGKALEVNPRYAKAWNNRGNVRQAQGDVPGAIEDYRSALEVDPTFVEAWNNRGIARQAQGDLAGAIEDFGKALEINPRYAEAWNNRGVARKAQGDLPGATEDYGKALEINPRYSEAWNNCGASRQAQGDLPGAIEDYARALEVAPPGWPHRKVTEDRLARARAVLAAREGGR